MPDRTSVTAQHFRIVTRKPGETKFKFVAYSRTRAADLPRISEWLKEHQKSKPDHEFRIEVMEITCSRTPWVAVRPAA